jgi:enoyl-CoA hydratase/carnithine racemase
MVPQDDLLDAAVETAAEIAFNPAESLRAIKGLAWSGLAQLDLMEVMKHEMVEFNAAMARPTFKEAVTSFTEKRQPDFHKF